VHIHIYTVTDLCTHIHTNAEMIIQIFYYLVGMTLFYSLTHVHYSNQKLNQMDKASLVML